MSNIKSKEFYSDAESMQKGWGKRLKSIDILKDRVEQKKDITLKDVCYILYGNGYGSHVWLGFQTYCKSKRWGKKQMPWEAWNGLFDTWVKEPKV